MTDSTMCYAAKHRGNETGYFFVSVDSPEHAKENARAVAKLIRKGAIVDRVPLEIARAGLMAYVKATRMHTRQITASPPKEAAR